ncbi:hypothetical protein [Neptuniibacter halophilus]|uniref:hypothetical protein n=1 Tax=Neptuniibacter halophilus TaxID=651666 RepID=UPI002572B6FA|nr:hypothetical protein [Neptuniibacter halophilus]
MGGRSPSPRAVTKCASPELKLDTLDDPQDEQPKKADPEELKIKLERQKQLNENQADTRKRVDTLVRYILTVTGVALSVSIGVFTNSQHTILSEDTRLLLAWSWSLLFSSIISMLAVMLLMIIGGYIFGERWKLLEDGELEVAQQPRWVDPLAWTCGTLGVVTFVTGLITLCIVAISSIPITHIILRP